MASNRWVIPLAKFSERNSIRTNSNYFGNLFPNQSQKRSVSCLMRNSKKSIRLNPRSNFIPENIVSELIQITKEDVLKMVSNRWVIPLAKFSGRNSIRTNSTYFGDLFPNQSQKRFVSFFMKNSKKSMRLNPRSDSIPENIVSELIQITKEDVLKMVSNRWVIPLAKFSERNSIRTNSNYFGNLFPNQSQKRFVSCLMRNSKKSIRLNLRLTPSQKTLFQNWYRSQKKMF